MHPSDGVLFWHAGSPGRSLAPQKRNKGKEKGWTSGNGCRLKDPRAMKTKATVYLLVTSGSVLGRIKQQRKPMGQI